MAVTVDGSSSSTSGGVVSSLTWSHTNNNAANLLMVSGGVGSTVASIRTTGVTYAAASMSSVWEVTDTNFCRSQAWSKNGSLATGANNVVASFDGTGTACGYGATSYTGHDTSTPLGTPATNGATTGNPFGVTFSSTSGDLGYAGICTDSETLGPGGTQMWEVENISSDMAVGAQTYPGAASISASWTLNASVGGAAGGVSIKAASGGATFPTLLGQACL